MRTFITLIERLVRKCTVNQHSKELQREFALYGILMAVAACLAVSALGGLAKGQ